MTKKREKGMSASTPSRKRIASGSLMLPKVFETLTDHIRNIITFNSFPGTNVFQCRPTSLIKMREAKF